MESHDFEQSPLFGSAPLPNNPPPQIFGNYAADGSLLPPSLPSGSLFLDDSFGFGYEDGDSNDPKRRRIARACDMCRRKKIKCDGKLPACSHCQNYKTECIFTHIEKKRQPPKGAKYIEGLENRLGRMEALLRLSGVLSDEDGNEPDLATLEQRLAARTSDSGSPLAPSVTSRPDSRQESMTQASPPPAPAVVPAGNGRDEAKPQRSASENRQKHSEREMSEIEALSDMMDSLVTNNHGETRYIGSSSSFSIFSPKGIRWVSEKIGDHSFQNMIANSSRDDNKWFHWKPEIFGDIFARRQFKALPPRDECMALLRDYFETFNKMFPLYHYETFMFLAEKQYSNEPYEGSGWWASLNVVLAIAYRLRVMANSIPSEDEAIGWAYIKNALAVSTELTLRNTDLFSVQALIGMCLFLQGSPNPQPVVNLMGSAIRLAQSIGLHKRGSGFGLTPAELEQRKRVFWIAYMVDKDMSLRSGTPPCQNDDDWNVDLPSENPEDGLGNVPLPDGSGVINLFHRMCKFAVIEGKIYSQLYSVKASKQTDGELLNHIGELDQDLEGWKDSIPIDFRPEHEINANNEPLIIQIVMLHFAYYNSVMTIHRMSVHHGYWSSRLSNYALKGLNIRPLNPRVFSSAALCVSAARASINLIKYIPAGDYACVWLIIYYPVSALVTLFANILQNPHEARARSDLRLINLVVSFLSRLCLEETSGSIRRMFIICREFERIAGVVLTKAEKDMSTRQKRKQEREEKKMDRIQQAPNQQQRQRLPGDTKGSDMSPSLGSPATPVVPSMMGSTSTSHGLGTSKNQQKQLNMDLNTSQPTLSPNANAPKSPWGNSAGGTPTSGLGLPSFPGFDFSYADMSDNGNIHSALHASSFQQPFVPQDLWNMSSTFEWDWADIQNQGAFDTEINGFANSNPTGQGATPQ